MIIDPSHLKIDEDLKLLTVEEAAKIARVSTSTIRNWSNGPLPVFRYGRVIRIERSILFSFIANLIVDKPHMEE
jgi:excisionase family DNA binding protein